MLSNGENHHHCGCLQKLKLLIPRGGQMDSLSIHSSVFKNNNNLKFSGFELSIWLWLFLHLINFHICNCDFQYFSNCLGVYICGHFQGRKSYYPHYSESPNSIFLITDQFWIIHTWILITTLYLRNLSMYLKKLPALTSLLLLLGWSLLSSFFNICNMLLVQPSEGCWTLTFCMYFWLNSK